MDNMYSLADIAAATGKDGFFGGEGGGGILVILFLIIAMMGGGYGNRESAATQADVQRAVDLSAVLNGQAELAADIQRTSYEQIGATKDAAYNNLSETRDVQAAVSAGFAAQATCCCDTQKQILENRYLAAQNTAEINAVTVAQTQKILDAISTNRMAEMQNQINALQLQNALCGVVRYPTASTYTVSNNPFCANSACGY